MSILSKLLVGVLGLASTVAMSDTLPHNPWLADSPWPISHHDPYASDVSPAPGPGSAAALGAPQTVGTNLVNISLPMSNAYPNGQRVWWGNDLLSVYKLALVNGRLTKVASQLKAGNPLVALSTPTSGAYTLVDRDGTFYTVQGTTVLAYADSQPGVLTSPIKLKARYTLPASVTTSDDAIVGLNLMWDGHLAFATRKAVVGVLTRDFQSVQSLQLGQGQDVISNSIAADENGGIYVVSSQAMYRVQWTGTQLSLDAATGAWQAHYNTGADSSGSGRLGAGSGSTPTLMGTSGQRFVVITDGAAVANLVLLWRDEIPADWQAIAPGKDRRIAAELPINFGDPNRAATQDEQSVTVSGYGAVAVSNDYRNVAALSKLGSTGALAGTLTNSLIELMSANPKVQPWGVQKFEWDPTTRTLHSSWATTEVSCPNAIPTMSEATQRFYCVGAYQGWWTIESLDWATGQGHDRKLLGKTSRYNSFYAQTQLTGDGGLIYGSFDGVVYLPAVTP